MNRKGWYNIENMHRGLVQMNLKEIEYIVKIADEGNITRAAEKLFLTPSALNQQLLHLENELGTRLFQRIRNAWVPTEAGQVYLAGAREMLRIKKETYRHLNDIVSLHNSKLTVSFPPERGSDMFVHVYPLFHQRYPNVTVHVIEASVRRQQELIARGEVDIGFVTLQEKQKNGDNYLPIRQEELVLVLPANSPLCAQARTSPYSKYPELPLAACSEEVFAFMNKSSTIYDYLYQLFRQAGFSPSVLFEATRAATILEMVAAGLCCSIVPDADSLEHIPGVAFFCLDNHPVWDLMACYKKGAYLSKPGQHFIHLAAQYWNGELPSVTPKP